jgi:hypothetical protein
MWLVWRIRLEILLLYIIKLLLRHRDNPDIIKNEMYNITSSLTKNIIRRLVVLVQDDALLKMTNGMK